LLFLKPLNPFFTRHSPFIIHHSSFTIHHSSFTIHHSPFTIHHSSFTIHHSSFTIHHSPFIIHHSSFIIYHSSFTIHHFFAMSSLSIKQRIECEDLVIFINACFACTRQQEFYSDSHNQAYSIEFLHEYILGNYRRLYARTLAAGINHFNQAQIIVNLLKAGSPVSAEDRAEEGALIAMSLQALPTNRAYQVLKKLQQQRVNNRRTRAIIRQFLNRRKDLVFEAVKYRRKFRSAVVHAHLKLTEEFGSFLFALQKQQHFSTPLFETVRKAHYSQEAIYQLPYTVAEGLAVKHKIPRERFLAQIEKQMTVGEKFRLQKTAEKTKKLNLDLDISKIAPTRLALYILSLPISIRRKRYQELHQAMTDSTWRTLQRIPMKLGKVAAVLDNSYSMSGSSEKKRRPLGVALAASYLLRAASQIYQAFWIQKAPTELLVQVRGQTPLGKRLLDALAWQPDLVIIISDGFENDPPLGAAEVARVYRQKIDPNYRTEIIHTNPVFDAKNYAPRTIGEAIPTVGLRDAEDLSTMLGFARFASGALPLSELEAYLAKRVKILIDDSQS
jgi:hypothetical protein